MFSNVKKHKRTLSSGRTISVKQHRRTRNKLPFQSRKGLFHLPVRTAIIVPSTSDTDKKISNTAFQKRVNQTRKFLADTNGGFTSVRSVGGFTDKNGKLVKEDVVVVESFTTKKDFVANRPKVRKFLVKKGKEWKQESMGYEYEDDLYYVDTDKK